MTNPQRWGVIVARFQTPYLTEAHINILRAVHKKHNKVLVVLGVRPALPSNINPLSFDLREPMVKEFLPNAIVVPLSDNRDDTSWSDSLDDLIRLVTANGKATLYAGRTGFQEHYMGKYEVVTLRLDCISPGISSTKIRNAISPEQYKATHFRAGVIYAYQQLPPQTLLTVDMAVFNSDGDKVLLGRKSKEGQFRFPGGMYDASDGTFAKAASRELREETGISIEVSTWNWLGDFDVQDWRSADDPNRTWHTMFFATKLPWGDTIRPGDDLAEVRWVTFDTFDYKTHLVSEHWPLWERLQTYVQEQHNGTE